MKFVHLQSSSGSRVQMTLEWEKGADAVVMIVLVCCDGGWSLSCQGDAGRQGSNRRQCGGMMWCS